MIGVMPGEDKWWGDAVELKSGDENEGSNDEMPSWNI